MPPWPLLLLLNFTETTGSERAFLDALGEIRTAVFSERETPNNRIRLDKPAYTCSDRVRLWILAPDWDSDPNRVDSIGDDPDHPVRIATRRSGLPRYRLSETGSDTGLFTGRVLLRCDGGESRGAGPDDGVLGAGRDDALSVSFRYSRRRLISASAPVGATAASVEFHRPEYALGETAMVRVRDADMNLDPEALDRVRVEVRSDSDLAGITVRAVETGPGAGEFEAAVLLSGGRRSGGDRLLAAPGDFIHATYEDTIPPPPAGRGDTVRHQAAAKVRRAAKE